MDNGTLCVIVMSAALLICKIVNRITKKRWNEVFFVLGIIVYLVLAFVLKK